MELDAPAIAVADDRKLQTLIDVLRAGLRTGNAPSLPADKLFPTLRTRLVSGQAKTFKTPGGHGVGGVGGGSGAEKPGRPSEDVMLAAADFLTEYLQFVDDRAGGSSGGGSAGTAAAPAGHPQLSALNGAMSLFSTLVPTLGKDRMRRAVGPLVLGMLKAGQSTGVGPDTGAAVAAFLIRHGVNSDDVSGSVAW